jgi:hypothetical protein
MMNIYYDNSVLFKKYIKTTDCLFNLIELATDLIVRETLEYRFIKGYSWTKIGLTMGYGDGNMPRIALTRYLKKYRQNAKIINLIKLQAIKEFAERLKQVFYNDEFIFTRSIIDNLVKEMVGDNNAE